MEAELGLCGADSVYLVAAIHLDIPLSSLNADQCMCAGQRFRRVDITQ